MRGFVEPVLDTGVIAGHAGGWTLTQVLAAHLNDGKGPHRLRVRVRRDFYDHQAYALAELWTWERGWIEVVRVDGMEPRMTCLPMRVDGDDTQARAFANTVRDDALAVLA